MKGDNSFIGNEGIVGYLGNVLDGGHPHHAYLFVGPSGIGKMTLARSVCRALLCSKSAGLSACGSCKNCRVNIDQHPDVTMIEREDGKKLIDVDRIRLLRERLSVSPWSALWKVGIVSGAENLSPAAANAILKTLEEPPDHTIIFLCTENAQSIPATIRSRSQILRFQPVPTHSLETHLHPNAVSSPIAYAFHRPGRLLSAKKKDLERTESHLREIVKILSDSSRNYTFIDLWFSRASKENIEAKTRELNELFQTLLRDLWLTDKHAGGRLYDRVLKDIQPQIKHIPENFLLECLALLRDIPKRMKENTHPRLLFESLIAKLP